MWYTIWNCAKKKKRNILYSTVVPILNDPSPARNILYSTVVPILHDPSPARNVALYERWPLLRGQLNRIWQFKQNLTI